MLLRRRTLSSSSGSGGSADMPAAWLLSAAARTSGALWIIVMATTARAPQIPHTVIRDTSPARRVQRFCPAVFNGKPRSVGMAPPDHERVTMTLAAGERHDKPY